MEVDELLEQGIEIPSDPDELAKLAEELGVDLEGVETAVEATGDISELTDDPEAGASDDKAAKAAEAAAKPSEGKSDETPTDQADHGPPKAILRRERENRHRAEQEAEQEREGRVKAEQERDTAMRRITELEAKTGDRQDKLQEAADRITGDSSIKLERLDSAALESLKDDLDDESVSFLTKLVNQHNALQEQLERVARANEVLLAEREQTQVDSQQDDVDSVPLLAMVAATRTKESDALFDRADAYDKALKSDPDWADKSRRERYQEVGRRLEAYIGKDVPEWLSEVVGSQSLQTSTRGKTVEDKLAAARDKATPDSLSDLPAGVAAAQHEMERLEAMSDFDVDDLIAKAMEKGPDALEELTARMMTADR